MYQSQRGCKCNCCNWTLLPFASIRIVAQSNSSVDQAGSGSRSRLEHVKRVAASSLPELPANRTAEK